MFKALPPTVQIAHSYLRTVLKPGGVGVDATAGNGLDTVLMAEAVCPGGRVYSFDIQEVAVMKTVELLKAKGLADNVRVYCESHERIGELVPELVDAVVFNLGYLPGGNRDIVTKPETTIKGVAEGLKIMRPGGIMCIVVYTGHSGGDDEQDLLDHFLQGLNKNTFCAAKLDFINRKNAPGLVIIEKNNLVSEVDRI